MPRPSLRKNAVASLQGGTHGLALAQVECAGLNDNLGEIPRNRVRVHVDLEARRIEARLVYVDVLRGNVEAVSVSYRANNQVRVGDTHGLPSLSSEMRA